MQAPWLLWTGAWILACALVLALLALRRAPTIWRGSSLLRFTLSLGVIAVAGTLARDEASTGPLIVAMSAVLFASWALRRYALVSGHDPAELATTVEDSARRVNLGWQVVPGGYMLLLPSGGMRVTFHPLSERLTVVAMRAEPPHRKAQLFAQLFAKQYRGVLPRIVVRQR